MCQPVLVLPHLTQLLFIKIYPFTKYEYDAQTKFLTCFAAFMDHCHVNEEQNGDQNDGKY